MITVESSATTEPFKFPTMFCAVTVLVAWLTITVESLPITSPMMLCCIVAPPWFETPNCPSATINLV